MTTPSATEQIPFSEAIKKGTWSEHGVAEAGDFVRELFRGQLSLEEYTQLVIQHYPIYVALENAGAALAADPAAAPFARPELARVAALEADLAFLLGDQWRDKIELLPSTQTYVDRINEVCPSSPQAFLAHHYTRYLGDLSGGQMIGKAVSKAYGFGDGPGAKFYVFDDIEDPNAFKEQYRSLIDALSWSEAERDDTIAEIIKAYALNTAQLTELGDTVLAARN